MVKYGGRKANNGYISNDQNHDQNFLHLALQEILKETALDGPDAMIIESDNCSSQYK